MSETADNRFYREPERPVVELGEMIASRRKEIGKSLQNLADASGLSKQHLHHLENGYSTNPSVGTLVQLGAALGISAHHLFRCAMVSLYRADDLASSRVRFELPDGVGK